MKILLLLLAPLAWGQVEGIPRRFDEVYHSPGAGQKTFPTGVAAGYTVTVIDGNAAGPCTTGGGSTKSQCRYSGSVWQSVGPASAGGGDAQTASPLSQFAPTTSSQLRSVISDETGGDAAVFATSPTITTPNIAGLTGTGTADFSGATAVIMARGTTAPSSGTCDAAAEEGSIYIRTDNPATNPTQAYHCAKTGASSWAWHLISHKVGATDPAKCDEGQIFYNTTSDTLRACTAADTWAAVGGSGGGDALTANPLSQFASTSSSQLRGVLNDETGTGPAVFGTSPTIDGLVGTGAVSFGSTTGLLLRFGTTAPSSADCDSAGERGAVYVQSGNPATVATRLLICTQTGASSYAWMPSSHKVEATDPATCTEGDLFYNTTSDTLRVCTATDTWGAIGSGGGGGTAATRLESEQGTSNTAMTTPLAATYSVASAGGCGVIMSSQTVTVFPGATTAHPCNMQTGNVTRRFTAPATVVLGTGSVSVNASEALIYMKPNGTLYAGLPSAFTVGSMTLSGITAETPVTDWPAGVTRVWKWLAGTTDNFWDTTGGDGNGGSNYISLRTKSSLLAGTGITITENSDGEETIAADPIMATDEEVATNANTYSVITGTTTLTMTTASLVSPNANGVCVWGKMGGSNSSGTVTLAVNGATARNVYKLNGSSDASQVGSELRANTLYQFCYDTSLGSEVWLVNPGGAGGGGSVATDAIFDAKGDMAIGTGADTAQKLTVGSNGMTPIAASGETTGVKWGYITKEDWLPSTAGCAYGSGWNALQGSEPAYEGSCGSPPSSGLPKQGYVGFSDGANTYAVYNWRLPSTFVALVSITYHFATDATSGNVAFRYGAMCFAATDSWPGATPSFTDDAVFTNAASAGNYGETTATHATTNVDSCSAAGARVAMKIGREGADGGDTNGNSVYLFGVTLKYTVRAE